jgi:hypothetical protein
MTGHVSECASFEGNPHFGDGPGPLVKCIRLRCITIEYEHFSAYIGSQLQFEPGTARGFVGPTSTGGVVFATQKKNAKAIYGKGKCYSFVS